jgi:UDP-N-acetylmuramoyl-tripeptide--D-alanyl-D-alanine ligase
MMGALSLRAIASELQSAYAGAELAATRISTDSRNIGSGDLYIALRGERFDGHDYLADVAAKGAVAAIVDKNFIDHNTADNKAPEKVLTALPQICVADTRAALGLVARMNRRRFNAPLIGITGSAGKTTCKEMLAAILAQRGAVLATRGNLNNEIGVPLTLLDIAPQHAYAVIEMGAARGGDIAYLCRFVEPDIALVTTALPAHLEGFGDIDNVAKTKGEIFAGLRADGVAIINGDSEYLALWQRLAGSRRTMTFGLVANTDVSARAIVRSPAGLQFELISAEGSIAIELQLLGIHNVRNALAAAAAALAAGASLENIRAGLASVQAVPGRLQSRCDRHGNIVIDDSYNANPGAVQAAIDVLAEYPGPRRLILGNMAELGALSSQLHRDVARYAAERGIEQCWFVGPHAQLQVQECLLANKSVSALAFADNQAVIAAGEREAVPVSLIKGSRSSGMEIIVATLCGDNTANGGNHTSGGVH